MNGSITIIGGDRRFLSVRDCFEKEDFSVNTVFLGEKDETSICDNVILPVPVARNGFLNAPMTDRAISVDLLVGMLSEKSTVFGGMINESLAKMCEKKEITLIDYYKDETLLNENAVLTAKAVPFILEENGISVKDGRIFILGYGRCGKAIADVLSSSGGNVTVVTGRQSIADYRFIHFENLRKHLNEASLVINTVPSTVLSEEELRKLNRNAIIIEIASSPFGIDFEAAKRLGINVIKAPSLPGRYFPKEAGEVIAKTVFKEMKQCQK